MPDAVIELLHAEWRSLGALLHQLDIAEWDRPTALPGWTVKDCVSHVTGTERMIMGDPRPVVDIDHLSHVGNPFAEVVEVWVEERRLRSPRDVHDEFDEQIARRTHDLETLTEADLNELTASPLGEMSRREFLKVRVFDTWMHEQDIRRALRRPGHLDGPVVVSAIERFGSALAFVVGKRAGAPDGSTVVFAITDPNIDDIAIVVEGRARRVERIPNEPTTHIGLRFETLVALGGGRLTAEEARDEGLTVEGDHELAERVLSVMAFTP